jgi:hypothetical protein
VRRLVAQVAALGRPLGAHFHNTRNTGFANAWTALEAGASALDASVGIWAAARSLLARRATSPPRTSYICSKVKGSTRVYGSTP